MGNIGGNVVANLFRNQMSMSWMWNLRTIGIMVGIIGIVDFFFLIDHPSKKGIIIELPDENEQKEILKRTSTLLKARKSGESDEINSSAKAPNNELYQKLIEKEDNEVEIVEQENGDAAEEQMEFETILEEYEEVEAEKHAISFWKAWLLPGVLQFAFCVAFVKLSTYGMLFWLPTYAKEELNYEHLDVELIAIAFDIGTIIGSISLGLLTDVTYKKRSPVAFFGLLIGTLLFLMVVFFSDSSKPVILVIIFLIGFFVGGIFNIVAATAAADLAKGDALKGNDKALATVSGILDGSGSLGAAFGSLIIGLIAQKSWPGVFTFLA